MSTVRISASKLPDVLQERFAGNYQKLVKLMQEAAMLGTQRIADSIEATKPYIPVDTGAYAASVHVERHPKGADVFNDAPYAGIIEYGSRPHWPPFAPLFMWAQRKLRGKGMLEGVVKRKGEKKRDMVLREAARWARAVQRAIAKRGTAPRHVFARALPVMRGDVAMLVRNARSMKR